MFSDEPARREKALFKRVVHRFLINCRVKIAKHNDANRSFFYILTFTRLLESLLIIKI